MISLTKNSVVNLNNEVKMPIIGLGTYQMNRFTLLKAVVTAFSVGFKAFDGAFAYYNEKSLGISFKFLFASRKKYFITSKYHKSPDSPYSVEQELDMTLKNLKVKYLDLYLMHWPYPGTFVDVWKQMEKVYQQGKVRAIGVCNFEQRHLVELLKNTTVIPAVNQIEIHPFMTQKETIGFCREKGIAIEAYCPFALMNEKLIHNDHLTEIAKKHNKTIPQIILRWNIEQNIIPIPKSATPSRIKENIDIFDFQLTEQEIMQIDQLDQQYKCYPPEKYCPGY